MRRAALGFVGAADLGGGVDLLQLLGHFVAANGHLLGARFFHARRSLRAASLHSAACCAHCGSLLRRLPDAAVRVFGVVRCAARVPASCKPAISCCFAANSFEQRASMSPPPPGRLAAGRIRAAAPAPGAFCESARQVVRWLHLLQVRLAVDRTQSGQLTRLPFAHVRQQHPPFVAVERVSCS